MTAALQGMIDTGDAKKASADELSQARGPQDNIAKLSNAEGTESGQSKRPALTIGRETKVVVLDSPLEERTPKPLSEGAESRQSKGPALPIGHLETKEVVLDSPVEERTPKPLSEGAESRQSKGPALTIERLEAKVVVLDSPVRERTPKPLSEGAKSRQIKRPVLTIESLEAKVVVLDSPVEERTLKPLSEGAKSRQIKRPVLTIERLETKVVVLDSPVEEGTPKPLSEGAKSRQIKRPVLTIERLETKVVVVPDSPLERTPTYDINKYLANQFSRIASRRNLDPTWPGQEIIHEISLKSSGNFILASTFMRFICDEDNPETRLVMSRPKLDVTWKDVVCIIRWLYMEVLKQQGDQDFLKTFLALLVGHNSIQQEDLHEDDATLMNVSEKDLHIKLKTMGFVIKPEPFIDVHHTPFVEFLQDPSRSGQYHVSNKGATRRYVELVVDSIVQFVSRVITFTVLGDTGTIQWRSPKRFPPAEAPSMNQDTQE